MSGINAVYVWEDPNSDINCIAGAYPALDNPATSDTGGELLRFMKGEITNTDFVQHCIEEGAHWRSASELAKVAVLTDMYLPSNKNLPSDKDGLGWKGLFYQNAYENNYVLIKFNGAEGSKLGVIDRKRRSFELCKGDIILSYNDTVTAIYRASKLKDAFGLLYSMEVV